jgi:hypothetical protein
MSKTEAREGWEEELNHKTRVEGFGGRVDQVHTRLRSLWEAAQPMTEVGIRIIGYIRSIRECNWRLEQSVWDLCKAIGRDDTTGLLYGHSRSITDARWQRFWAYYTTLQNWLPKNFDPGGYAALLRTCDPTRQVQKHVLEMLGERTDLKELYVKRFCLWLEWTVLGGMFRLVSSRGIAHTAAVNAIEEKIREQDPDLFLLPWIQEDGQGHTELCHHKAFRRYDIIISSIGAGKWRARVPEESTAATELLDMHDRFLQAIETWIEDSSPDEAGDVQRKVHELLGQPSPGKRFLAAFLSAVLTAQRGNLQNRIDKKVKAKKTAEPSVPANA